MQITTSAGMMLAALAGLSMASPARIVGTPAQTVPAPRATEAATMTIPAELATITEEAELSTSSCTLSVCGDAWDKCGHHWGTCWLYCPGVPQPTRPSWSCSLDGIEIVATSTVLGQIDGFGSF